MRPTAVGFMIDFTTEEWAAIAMERQSGLPVGDMGHYPGPNFWVQQVDPKNSLQFGSGAGTNASGRTNRCVSGPQGTFRK
jgi:hypothetical protein